MGKLTIGGITYDNPKQIDQATVLIPPGNYVNLNDPAYVAGAVWKQSTIGKAFPVNTSPKPDTVDFTPPTANPVLFGQQPPSLSAGGITIPNGGSFKNPA